MKKRSLNNSGIALVLSLIVTMFLLTFGSVLLMRTFSQRFLLEREKYLVNASYLSEAAAQAGKHIICTKPMVVSLEEAQRTVALVRQHKI